MADKDFTTNRPGVGPKTIDKVHKLLGSIIALSYLGKRAFTEGEYTPEGWQQILREFDCPLGAYDLDSLNERAFDSLLRMTSKAWQMLFDPEDAVVEGKYINRTAPNKEETQQPSAPAQEVKEGRLSVTQDVINQVDNGLDRAFALADALQVLLEQEVMDTEPGTLAHLAGQLYEAVYDTRVAWAGHDWKAP